jgi:alginate O-acetyltransferase complex protein AlgI
MAFTSSVYLFIFFPLFLLIYYFLPTKFKNGFLLVSSLIFYAWGEANLVFLIIFSALCNYFFGRKIEKSHKNPWLIVSLIFNLSILFFYKYLNFTFDNIRFIISAAGFDAANILPVFSIIVPLGLSFLTFRAISYSLDVYKRKIPASRNVFSFLTYYLMFPPLIAGPIVRYTEISTQMDSRKATIEDVSTGIERFIIGLIKKVLIANNFSTIAFQVFSAPLEQISMAWAWIGLISFFFQIYFDFSGYSDMAIGVARMMGFKFNENFNYPYIAKDIRDFWRRWHISLSTWLRDYIFLPVSFSLSRRWKNETVLGIRTDRVIHISTVLITFAICGFWHGPTWGYIFWGIYFGFFIIVESAGFGKILKKGWRPLQHLYTLMVVLFGWVFFRTEKLDVAFQFLGKLFSFSQGDPVLSSYLYSNYLTKEIFILLPIGMVFMTPFYQWVFNTVETKWPGMTFVNIGGQFVKIIVLLTLLVLSLAYVTGGTHNPFIYSRY